MNSRLIHTLARTVLDIRTVLKDTKSMPSKNTLKLYLENSHYHIYNRGLDKQIIFNEEQDCHVFLRYVKLYLSPPEEILRLSYTEPRLRRFVEKNLSADLDLLSFGLMPNHFHMQIFQRTPHGIETFMRRLGTSYSSYFNRKYKRIGPMFQSRYKAALIEDDIYFLHISRYIHLNHTKLPEPKRSIYRKYSSLPYYFGELESKWLKPQLVLERFNTLRNTDDSDMLSYESFLSGNIEHSENILGSLILSAKDSP